MSIVKESIVIASVTDFVAPAMKDLTEKLAPLGTFPNAEALEIVTASMAELARLVWTSRQEVIQEASNVIDHLQELLDIADAKLKEQAS